jgi:hypothetical protein
MESFMRRSSILSAAVLLAASSSLAFGLVIRHGGWTAAIAGKDGSPIKGSATMKAGKDAATTEIDVKYAGDTPSTTRPWHVHIGSCAKAGGVWGGGKAYAPLAGDAKGAAESKATIAMALPDTGSYYVNVHESATNMGKIVACGDLKADK